MGQGALRDHADRVGLDADQRSSRCPVARRHAGAPTPPRFARRRTAPTSADSRPRTTTEPSSSSQRSRCRSWCRRRSCSPGRTAIDPPPGTYQSLHVRGRGATREVQQVRLVLGRGHARHRADLRVGQLAATHGVAQPGQRPECSGHPHLLAGGAQVEAGPPVQPVGTGAKALAPTVALVEPADEHEQFVGGGLDARRQLGDGIAETLGVTAARSRCNRDGDGIRRGIDGARGGHTASYARDLRPRVARLVGRSTVTARVKGPCPRVARLRADEAVRPCHPRPSRT